MDEGTKTTQDKEKETDRSKDLNASDLSLPSAVGDEASKDKDGKPVGRPRTRSIWNRKKT